MRFTPLQTYKVLKRKELTWQTDFSFTPLQTYKVLKHQCLLWGGTDSFTPLQTYKVLKLYPDCRIRGRVLHHYKLTRFSNAIICDIENRAVLHHYKLTRFSNKFNFLFVLVNCFTPLQTYKVLKQRSKSSSDRSGFTPLQTYKVLKQ